MPIADLCFYILCFYIMSSETSSPSNAEDDGLQESCSDIEGEQSSGEGLHAETDEAPQTNDTNSDASPDDASTDENSFHSKASSDVSDPFEELQGLGEDLEENFVELDERLANEEQHQDPFAGQSLPEHEIPEVIRRILTGIGDIKVVELGQFRFFRNPGGVDIGGFNEIFNEMTQMFQDNRAWSDDITKQAYELSRNIAQQGRPEPNVDPVDRIALEQLVRVAEMRVAAITDLDVAPGQFLKIEVMNRAQWAQRTVDDYEKFFRALAQSITSGVKVDEDGTEDPMKVLVATLGRVLGPAMGGIAAGTIVGRLAQRAFGGYELPIPRLDKAPLMLVFPNIDSFSSLWSLSRDDLRLHVCLHEVVYNKVFSIKHVRDKVEALLLRHASSFNVNATYVEELFDNVDLSTGPEKALTEIHATMNNPESLLKSMRSSAQEDLQPELTALLAAIMGYVDYVVDSIGSTLIKSYEQLCEALQRHRTELSTSDRFAERMLGLEIDQSQHDRGNAFIKGIVERAGEESLKRLFDDPSNLPTPAEVDAPGLWLARIDLPSSTD